jgi:hypothetical protein
MTVQTIDKSQVCSLQNHLDRAAVLDPHIIEEIRRLAAQLQDLPVLPIIGAGGSHDCGMRLARDIGNDLYDDYMSDPAYEPRNEVERNLADVAQAIYNKNGQVAVARALGLPDRDLWPETARVGEHFCAYRVLARLAREDLFEEAIGFNYDCCKEAGLVSEGFLRSARTIPGLQFRDHLAVISDRETLYRLQRNGAVTYYKAHGCAERFRELAIDDEAKAAETIIARTSQLTTWHKDGWMQGRLRDRAGTMCCCSSGSPARTPAFTGSWLPCSPPLGERAHPESQS